VRVEVDSTQRLWQFDADGKNPRVVMAGVDSVGYFEWLDPVTLAIFVVGNPHTLRIVDVATGQEVIVARDIGRFIRCVPGTRDVTYSLKKPDDTWRFMLLASGAAAGTWLIDAPATGQDAVWLGDVLLATSGSEIFMARPAAGGEWQVVADVSTWGASGASRIAVAPDQRSIAIVCAE
jgi:hypothetical protein